MFPVDIDFDESRREWRKNKVDLGNGQFRYRCAHFRTQTQQFCKKHPVYRSPYCHLHNKKPNG